MQIASLKKETAELRAAGAERDARIGQQARVIAVQHGEPSAARRSEVAVVPHSDKPTVADERPAKPAAIEAVSQATMQDDVRAELFDPAKPTKIADGTIGKWQQPDGSLFFGERPRPGSKLLGLVSRMGTAGGNPVN
jgi:hypothetical protein